MTMLSSVSKRFSSLLSTISIEPVVFLYISYRFLILGSQVRTNLILFKICTDELGYNDTFCEDTDSDAYEDVEDDIQSRANDYFLIETWLFNTPAVVWSLFAGALSDDVFGRKPLLILPLAGFLVTSVIDIVMVAIYRDVPLEYFLLSSIGFILGGEPVYYMGYYGLGASITSPEERAARMARFDGVEQFGQLVATLVSPVIFDRLGNYGSFGFSSACVASALAYVVFVVEEPRKIESRRRRGSQPAVATDDASSADSDDDGSSGVRGFFRDNLVRPTARMVATLTQRRPGYLRSFVLIQVVCLGMYWFMVEQVNILYLWLLHEFSGFDGTDYSYYTVYYKLLGITGLMLVMPLLSRVLGVHESVILVGINAANAAGYVATAFTVEVWQFYLAQALTMMWYSEFSAARALMSKSVDEDDVGKVYSAVGIVGALLPIASNPSYRELYDATLDSFPSAFLLFSASLTAVVGAIMVPLAVSRKKMQAWLTEEQEMKMHATSEEKGIPKET